MNSLSKSREHQLCLKIEKMQFPLVPDAGGLHVEMPPMHEAHSGFVTLSQNGSEQDSWMIIQRTILHFH